jgi:hypothetical protein
MDRSTFEDNVYEVIHLKKNIAHTTTWTKLLNSQGNNEEQAHTRNKGTNEHDWKETAIFLETSINTWGWPI